MLCVGIQLWTFVLSLKVPPKHFSGAEVWNGPLQQLDSFLFQLCLWSSSCCMTQLEPSFNCQTDGPHFMLHSVIERCPDHHASTTVLHSLCWYLKVVLCTPPDVFTLVSSVWRILFWVFCCSFCSFANLSCATTLTLDRRGFTWQPFQQLVWFQVFFLIVLTWNASFEMQHRPPISPYPGEALRCFLYFSVLCRVP